MAIVKCMWCRTPLRVRENEFCSDCERRLENDE